RELRYARVRYEHTALSCSDGLWSWDVRGDACTFSEQWNKLFGLPVTSGPSTIDVWLDRVHPDDIDALRDNLEAHLEGLTPGHVFEHRVRHRNGRWRWVVTRAVAHRNDLGQVTEVTGSLTDITRRKSSESMLHTDATTGLASRMWLMESLGEAIESLHQVPHPSFVLLFLNVDGFKVVNESIGLDSGDRILSQLGERLLGNVASNHLVCRYGGDEFAILMRGDTTVEDAERLSAIIQDGLNRPFIIDGQEVFTSISAGVTSSAIGYERPAEVLRDVGIALTEAKRTRRGGCVVFQPEMRQQAMTALRLQTELRQAVDRDELEVHYQPIMNLSSSVMSGFEALVRWRHPERGMVMPDEFVTVAEETGLIIPIGKMVLERACCQLAVWLERYPSPEPLAISV
ncbi:MAG: putative bifunctional diguanylate cyclase/phosphodiesterase, partial [Nannocystaceae bacterium]